MVAVCKPVTRDTREVTLDPMVLERIEAAEALKNKALHVKDYVSSNIAWKKFISTVSTAADAVRGYRPARLSLLRRRLA